MRDVNLGLTHRPVCNKVRNGNSEDSEASIDEERARKARNLVPLGVVVVHL